MVSRQQFNSESETAAAKGFDSQKGWFHPIFGRNIITIADILYKVGGPVGLFGRSIITIADILYKFCIRLEVL